MSEAESDAPYCLKDVTQAAFSPKVERDRPFAFGSIATTEVCNLECVMCHFNGPNAVKKGKQLPPDKVRLVLDQIPHGSQVYFAATGEFFIDPHAIDHLQAALDRGLVPLILSHGQLYTPDLLDRLLGMGVRGFRMSCDAIDASHYERIRRGGKFENILATIDHLNSRRSIYPNLSIEINCTLFKKTFSQQKLFEEFWSGKVDAINFNAEYYNTWNYRNIMFNPEERVNCRIQTYVLPSGKIAPCCAIMVHAHDNDVDWLPSVETHTLEEAYTELCDMYDDPNSPLGRLCSKCDWWIMWTPHKDGATPYMRVVHLDTPETCRVSGTGAAAFDESTGAAE
jgi:Radical SAM superfamily